MEAIGEKYEEKMKKMYFLAHKLSTPPCRAPARPIDDDDLERAGGLSTLLDSVRIGPRLDFIMMMCLFLLALFYFKARQG